MTKLNFEPNTIWIGDNLPIMRGMNSKSVDLIYLDPPLILIQIILQEAVQMLQVQVLRINGTQETFHKIGSVKLSKNIPELHDYVDVVKTIKNDSMRHI